MGWVFGSISLGHLSPAPWVPSTPIPPLSPAQCPPASCTSSTISWQRWRGQSRWWSHARSQEKCSLSSSPGIASIDWWWRILKEKFSDLLSDILSLKKLSIFFFLYCIVIIMITLCFYTNLIMIISYLWMDNSCIFTMLGLLNLSAWLGAIWIKDNISLIAISNIAVK